MCPVVELFGRTIPTYGLMGTLGALAGLLLIALRCRARGLSTDDAVYIYVLGFVGCLVGAKLLYLLTVLPELLRDLPLLVQEPRRFLYTYLSGGMVYYGGFIGGVASAALAARWFRVRLRDYIPALLPALALVSGFGRVGCFLAGCCYGVETALPIGVVFPAGGIAPAGVPLLPVQLMETCLDLILCLVMIRVTDHPRLSRYSLRLYVLLYGVVRFGLEFVRGDVVRGSWLGLSTSQWISLALMLAAAVSLIRDRRRETEGP